jgi:YfiH family protein
MMSSIGLPTTKIDLLRYNRLAQHPEITHFTTSRVGGVSTGDYSSLNLSEYSGDNPNAVAANRQLLCQEIGVPTSQLFLPFQTHEDRITILDDAFLSLSVSDQKIFLNGVDALITSIPNICIGVTTADCVPILLYDPVCKVAAVVHAGWRGTVKHLASKTVALMVAKFHSNPTDIVAVMGPSISPAAFEVGEEVATEFTKSGFSDCILTNYPKPHIDLWAANRQDLTKAGLHSQNIEVSGICTFTHHEQFFSARRLDIQSGRIVTGIFLKL